MHLAACAGSGSKSAASGKFSQGKHTLVTIHLEGEMETQVIYEDAEMISRLWLWFHDYEFVYEFAYEEWV